MGASDDKAQHAANRRAAVQENERHSKSVDARLPLEMDVAAVWRDVWGPCVVGTVADAPCMEGAEGEEGMEWDGRTDGRTEREREGRRGSGRRRGEPW